MTHEQHYAEAERLRALAVETYMNPEGGYDDTDPPSAQELEIREAVRESARADAALFMAESQVHATLALYKAMTVRVEVGFDPSDPAKVHEAMCEAMRTRRPDFGA